MTNNFLQQQINNGGITTFPTAQPSRGMSPRRPVRDSVALRSNGRARDASLTNSLPSSTTASTVSSS
jgi:hypothetical protein